MQIESLITLCAVLILAPTVTDAQTKARRESPEISGTWRTQTPDGPKEIIVRPDSSVSFGEEIVRWRLVSDTIYMAFGDEWVGYLAVRKDNTLTLSGGDLEEPVDLTWVGPPTPLPEDVPVPAAPPMNGTPG